MQRDLSELLPPDIFKGFGLDRANFIPAKVSVRPVVMGAGGVGAGAPGRWAGQPAADRSAASLERGPLCKLSLRLQACLMPLALGRRTW